MIIHIGDFLFSKVSIVVVGIVTLFIGQVTNLTIPVFSFSCFVPVIIIHKGYTMLGVVWVRFGLGW